MGRQCTMLLLTVLLLYINLTALTAATVKGAETENLNILHSSHDNLNKGLFQDLFGAATTFTPGQTTTQFDLWGGLINLIAPTTTTSSTTTTSTTPSTTTASTATSSPITTTISSTTTPTST